MSQEGPCNGTLVAYIKYCCGPTTLIIVFFEV
jgi:hypothetical protein